MRAGVQGIFEHLGGSFRGLRWGLGTTSVVFRIHLIVKLLIDNYLIVNICLRWDLGIIDMRADLAMPPAWKPSSCNPTFMQLQPLHCHLLEGLRLCHWKSQWLKRPWWGPQNVQTLHQRVHGYSSRRTRGNQRPARPFWNVPYTPWKHLPSLPCGYPQTALLIK